MIPDIDKIQEEIAELGVEESLLRSEQKLARFRQRQYEESLKPYNEALDYDQDEQTYFGK